MKQISVIVENKVGILSDISYIMGTAHINIDSLYVGQVGDKSIVIMSVKDEKKTMDLLKANSYEVFSSDVLLVKLKDEPGSLSEITKLLADNKVNIESAHVVAKGGGYVIDAIKVDRYAKAEKLLKPYLKIED